MKFSVLYLPTYVPELDGPIGQLYEHMLQQIVLADELGYTSAWLTEHHFHPYGGTIANPAVFGAAIARMTKRIRIGTAVTVLPLHNPLLVAEDFAMLDVLSNGRMDFGIGRGSVATEFHEFGLPLDDSSSLTGEQVEIIRKAWSEERFSHHGEHYSYENLALLPRPVQQPHPPIWYGAARTASSFEWAGRNGFHLMILPYMFPPEYLQERLALYRSGLQEAGHDPADFQIMAKFHVFVADSAEDACQAAAEPYNNYGRLLTHRLGKEPPPVSRAAAEWNEQVRDYKIITGSPRDCIERIRYWQQQLGITEIGGTFHFGGLSHEATLRSIERFARDVAPAFDA